MFLLISASILSNVKIREHEKLLNSISGESDTLCNPAQYVLAISYQYHDVCDSTHCAAKRFAIVNIESGSENYQQGCSG